MVLPLVTIIIPCYQQSQYLEEAFRSIECQRFPSLEVIVVDDGSTPPVSLPEGIWSFELRLIRQNNLGLSSARNTGILHANGKLIKFLDADDILLEGCLHRQTANIDAHGTAIGIIGFEIRDHVNQLTKEVIPHFGEHIGAFSLINIAPIHSYIFPYHLLHKVGGFSTEKRVSGGYEDYDLLLRLCIEGIDVITVHCLGVAYNLRHGTMSTESKKMEHARIQVWTHFVHIFLNQNSSVRLTILMSILTQVAFLLENTSVSETPPLIKLFPLIAKHLEQQIDTLDSNEIMLLKIRLQKFPCAKMLTGVLNTRKHDGHRSSISVSSQDIIDYRTVLGNVNARFDDQWLIQLFSIVKKHCEHFAIYGAGKIGRRIAAILQSAGFYPKYFFDKNAENLRIMENDCRSSQDSITIKNVDEIASSDVHLLVIGSVFYYEQIVAILKQEHPGMELF
ncbi:MAG: glycosyltransferase family 2 protein [Deltaproteobacteria bacterium]|nr:glycosyltransferase family 2 protein [Deltaproteobacteria bacterium]